tara:strand:+ start:136 stop:774 length:639 start_codon:yes stop_codon:yes gene_type:complete
MKSGIYKISCGKRFYIGSSKNMPVRWQNHQSAFRRGNHANAYMQNLWNKTRGHGFDFEVLISCAEDMMLSLEQNLIDHHWGDKCFMNLSPKANAPRGWKGKKRGAWMQSEAFRKKMSEATKGKKTKEHAANIKKAMLARVYKDEWKAKCGAPGKSVYVVMDNDERLLFASVRAAKDSLGVGATTINGWLKGRSSSFIRKGIKEIGYAKAEQE